MWQKSVVLSGVSAAFLTGRENKRGLWRRPVGFAPQRPTTPVAKQPLGSATAVFGYAARDVAVAVASCG